MEQHEPSIPPISQPSVIATTVRVQPADLDINIPSQTANTNQGFPLNAVAVKNLESGSTIAYRIPVELAWRDLDIQTKSKKNFRSILHHVSGIVKPGEFLAIIGASGAGKTTLLNYLSGKMLAHNLEANGSTTINGKSTKESQNYLEFTAFVQQDDVLMETMTVQECLQYAARFKFSSDPDRRNKRLFELLEELELNDIKNLRFGGMNQRDRVLSRGEKKRLSIAVELITNPSLLFLDEPTTSMDTFTAEKIISIINKLKSKGRTVIATIHQPNTEIYNNFDKLMIMSLGRVVYHVNFL